MKPKTTIATATFFAGVTSRTLKDSICYNTLPRAFIYEKMRKCFSYNFVFVTFFVIKYKNRFQKNTRITEVDRDGIRNEIIAFQIGEELYKIHTLSIHAKTLLCMQAGGRCAYF